MIDRRQMLTMGGLLGALVPGREGVAEGVGTGVGQMSDRYAQDMVNALKGITAAIYAEQSFDALAAVRKIQVDYLRAQGTFPDFIDVGTDVWFSVHDWHIRLQQPLALGRDANGRYTIALAFTTLVLRHDVTPAFISAPYNNR